jgi:hypothetical protein
MMKIPGKDDLLRGLHRVVFGRDGTVCMRQINSDLLCAPQRRHQTAPPPGCLLCMQFAELVCDLSQLVSITDP